MYVCMYVCMYARGLHSSFDNSDNILKEKEGSFLESFLDFWQAVLSKRLPCVFELGDIKKIKKNKKFIQSGQLTTCDSYAPLLKWP